jgi:hypothetical protein
MHENTQHKKNAREVGTAASKAAMLAAYRNTANIRKATEIAGICRRSHYDWLDNDETYAADFAAAGNEAIQNLEDEATRRAIEGVTEPVVHQGQFTYPQQLDPETGKPMFDADGKPVISTTPLTIRKYSDTLLIFLLKGARPEKYRDNLKVDSKVEVAGSLSIADVIRQRRFERLGKTATEEALEPRSLSTSHYEKESTTNEHYSAE